MPKSQTPYSRSVKTLDSMQSAGQRTASILSARLLAAHRSGSLALRAREVVKQSAATPPPTAA